MATYGSIRYSGIEDAGVAGGGAESYADVNALPSNPDVGELALVSSTNKLYVYDGSSWFNIAIVNQAPTAITGNQASYELALDGTPTVVTLVSTDPEGFPLTWSATTSGDTQVGALTQADNVFTITPSIDEADVGTLIVTFSVTDGANTENSTSTFTLTFASAFWDETVLSIGTSSTNGLANSTFIDRSTNAHTVTPAGSPVQTAFHPYLDNWSVEFDGTGDYLTVPYTTDFQLTADFTIEFWVNPTSRASTFNCIINNYSTYTSNGGFAIFAGHNSANTSKYNLAFNGSFPVIESTSDISYGSWTHIALVRSGSTLSLYVNGVAEGTSTQTATVTGTANNWWIGTAGDSITTGYFDGSISNVRVVKGTALYTSNFTPLTEKLTAVSGTSLLTCQSNRFIDNSSSAHAITVEGDPAVSAFSPFGQESEYADAKNKGSTYFATSGSTSSSGGTGQYAQSELTSTLTLDTNDFTVECWFYGLGKIREYPRLIQIGPQNTPWGSNQFAILHKHDSDSDSITVAMEGIGVNDLLMSSGPIKDNVWYHVAVTRSGSTFTLYINGESVDTYTSSGSATGTGDKALIVGSSTAGDSDFYGYVSDLRVVNGIAVYTSNFTPPTAPVENTNADLYLPMDNAGVFDKTANNILTLGGNTSTSTTQTKFADTAIYFDGSGDYLRTNSGIFNNAQDYTVEYWIYWNAVRSGYDHIWDNRDGGQGFAFYGYGSAYRLANNSTGGSSFGSGRTAGVWRHHALVWSNGSMKIYIDGTLIYTRVDTRDMAPSSDYHISTSYAGHEANVYIEGFQVIQAEKYTTNFTPPNRTQGRTYQAES